MLAEKLVNIRCVFTDQRLSQPAPGFSRRRLENVAISKVKGTHLEHVCPPEPSPESGLKIAGQALDKLLFIASSFRPVLLMFYDTTTYGPVRGGHDRICGANGSMARSIDGSGNVRQYGVVGRSGRSIERLLLPSHVEEPL